MARGRASLKNIDKLKGLAEQYGVENNPLFLTTLDRYTTQMMVIESMREALDAESTIVEKEYVKGRGNVYAHPLIKELPKACDSANKTADMLLKIIDTLGEKKKAVDPLLEFIGGGDA